MSQIPISKVFEPVITFPDPDARQRLASLRGLDQHITDLAKVLSTLVDPDGLKRWAKKFHSKANNLVDIVLRRPPLIVLEGDVGCGKTELASTIGDLIARQEKIGVTLFPMSLTTRGSGLVGEMTQLISAAFDHTLDKAKKYKNATGKSRGGVILLVDEADSLTTSRANMQMHHEDKTGVNTFIRGLDRIGNEKLPAAVIMCTNRVGALDPAVKRRAALILTFNRPNELQRVAALAKVMKEVGFSAAEVKQLGKITGPNKELDRDYGYSYSDLTQRLLPAIVLDAYPDQAISAARALEIASSMAPTPPFKESGSK